MHHKNSTSSTFNALRKQAEKLLKKNPPRKKIPLDTEIHKLIHELSIHQLELELQNDELQTTLLQLEKTQTRYRELYDLAPVGYLSLNEKNFIVEANLTSVSLLGIRRNQLINQPFSHFISQAHQNIFYNHRQQVLSKKTKQTCELELIKTNGMILHAHLESIAVPDEANNCNQLHISIIDITDRKHTEIALKISEEKIHRRQLALNQAARMNSMGAMASVLAHELTQPLSAITNFSAGCIHRMKINNYQFHELLAVMQEIEQQAIRAGDIIHCMKNFVRQGKLHYETIELHELIHETVSLIKQELIQTAIVIQLELVNESLHLVADKIQLELVLLNLIRNSIEALIPLHKREITISTKKIHQNLLGIKISDTGPGLSPQALEHLFDFCFTTKPNGLGLGLPICRSIVEAHGGELILKANQKTGACFELTLPINPRTI